MQARSGQPITAFGPSGRAPRDIWGILNQLGLNALMIVLNRHATQARGAVMGLNIAVTYSAVFAGPLVMGPFYAGFAFSAVSIFAAALIVAEAVVSRKTS